MRGSSRLVGLKLNIGVYVIDTEVVLKLGVYLLFALHHNAMFQVVICKYGSQGIMLLA